MSGFNAETVAEVTANWDRAVSRCAEAAALASTIAADSYARLGQAKMAAKARALAKGYTQTAQISKNVLFLERYGNKSSKMSRNE